MCPLPEGYHPTTLKHQHILSFHKFDEDTADQNDDEIVANAVKRYEEWFGEQKKAAGRSAL
jgi:hypothetical protein